MEPRQSEPHQWLIVNRADIDAIKRLAMGSGVVLITPLSRAEEQQLRRLGRSRKLIIVRESPGNAVRVHNVRELTKALLHRSRAILVSPIYRTTSHPEQEPLPRMRAATLARLAKRRVIALGGMNAGRFAVVAPLGFVGWAGISAFRI